MMASGDRLAAGREEVGPGRARSSAPARWSLRPVPLAVALALAVAMFISVFALRLNVDNQPEGISLLYTLPIAFVALRLGAWAGIAAALFALALFGAYVAIEQVEVGPVGFGTRALAFSILGGSLGYFSERVRGAEGSLADQAAQLAGLMDRVDPLDPGRRASGHNGQHHFEMAALVEAFNEMLDRLEAERRHSAWNALAAQDEERRRLARELHDEVGQMLTGLVLHLELATKKAPAEIRPELIEAQENARTCLEDVRRIMHELRPETLDDLGLVGALASLSSQLAQRTGVQIDTELDDELPPLTPAAELVVYRIAQETLTNAVRHSGCSRIDLQLAREGSGGICLSISDEGRGMKGQNGSGQGIRGMRERALTIGAELMIRTRPAVPGTRVALRMQGDGATPA